MFEKHYASDMTGVKLQMFKPEKRYSSVTTYRNASENFELLRLSENGENVKF